MIKQQNEDNAQERRQTELLKGYKKSTEVVIDKNIPRTEDYESIMKEQKDKRHLNKKLPVYFHNIGTRLGVTNHHAKTLRDIHVSNTEYVNKNMMNSSKQVFRVDPTTQNKIDAPRTEKKSKYIEGITSFRHDFPTVALKAWLHLR